MARQYTVDDIPERPEFSYQIMPWAWLASALVFGLKDADPAFTMGAIVMVNVSIVLLHLRRFALGTTRFLVATHAAESTRNEGHDGR